MRAGARRTSGTTTRILVSLSRGREDFGPHYESLLAIDEALNSLEDLDSRAARVVELRVFGGLKTTATVKRDWNFARARLLSRLRECIE